MNWQTESDWSSEFPMTMTIEPLKRYSNMTWIGRIASWFSGTRKSMGASGVGLRAALSGGSPGGWASDHREETAHNTGFNYIAIHAIASQVAGATVSSFADGDQQSRLQSRRKSLARHAGTYARWKSIYGADDRETDPLPSTHSLVRLLKRPNPYESGASFRYRQALQIRLTGTCLIWNVPSVTGLTCERYVIPTAMASPVAPTAELPRGGWRINPVASRYTPIIDDGYIECPSWYRILGQIVDARQVQVIRLPHAWYLDDGQSPLSAGAKWVDAGEAVDEARYHQLKNGIDPSIVWNLPPDVSPDQDEMDRIQSKISSKYGGPSNVGRVMVAQNGTSITPLSVSPKEMCFSEGFQDLKSAVLALHQTPPVAVGLQEPGAYAAYNASMKAWRHSAIQPLCDLLAESETEHLAPQFGTGLTVEIESDTVDDTDLIERQLQNDLAAKVRTKNEWRAVRGMPPLPGSQGDELVGTDPSSTGKNPNEQGDHPTAMKPSDFKNINSRSEWIAQLVDRLQGTSPSLRSDWDWQTETKAFDPNLHPHGALGRFARTGTATAHKLISRILSGEESSTDPKNVAHHLSKLSTSRLVKLHQKNDIDQIPENREHLERSVLARLSQFPKSDTHKFASQSGSRKTTVHIQNGEKVNERLPLDSNGHRRPPLTPRQWGQLVGARAGAKVHVFPTALRQVTIVVDHPDYYARRILNSESITNEYMIVAPEKQKSGIGLRVTTQQVNSAKKLGYKFIEAGAAGNGKKISVAEHDWKAQGMKDPAGYYAWARLGFDGRIGPLMKARAKSENKELNAIATDFNQKFPGVTKVSELMLTKKGQKWWQDYGGYFEGIFELSDESISHRVLTRYAAEKQKKSQRKALTAVLADPWHGDEALVGSDDNWHPASGILKGTGNQTHSQKKEPVCENPDPLTPEDEEILDRIWDEIAKEMGVVDADENDPEVEGQSSGDSQRGQSPQPNCREDD
jgi:hypothetical protein